MIDKIDTEEKRKVIHSSYSTSLTRESWIYIETAIISTRV